MPSLSQPFPRLLPWPRLPGRLSLGGRLSYVEPCDQPHSGNRRDDQSPLDPRPASLRRLAGLQEILFQAAELSAGGQEPGTLLPCLFKDASPPESAGVLILVAPLLGGRPQSQLPAVTGAELVQPFHAPWPGGRRRLVDQPESGLTGLSPFFPNQDLAIKQTVQRGIHHTRRNFREFELTSRHSQTDHSPAAFQPDQLQERELDGPLLLGGE